MEEIQGNAGEPSVATSNHPPAGKTAAVISGAYIHLHPSLGHGGKLCRKSDRTYFRLWSHPVTGSVAAALSAAAVREQPHTTCARTHAAVCQPWSEVTRGDHGEVNVARTKSCALAFH